MITQQRQAANQAAVSAAAAAPPQEISAQFQATLDRHNPYRAAHSAPAMTWSAQLASAAVSYAANCKFERDPNGMAGETLYAPSHADYGTTQARLINAIDLWYDEVEQYDFNNPGFSGAKGHFTQLVRKQSTQLGCAVQVCPSSVGGYVSYDRGTLVVCRYSPPGNVLGQFEQNVDCAAYTLIYMALQPLRHLLLATLSLHVVPPQGVIVFLCRQCAAKPSLHVFVQQKV